MKKGFTLIELLAVIIILAIVALIATPIVLDVVDDAKKSAAQSEANMIVSGINNYCAAAEMKAQLGTGTDDCVAGTLSSVTGMVDLGNAEVVGSVTLSGNNVTNITVSSNGYKVTLSSGSWTISKAS